MGRLLKFLLTFYFLATFSYSLHMFKLKLDIIIEQSNSHFSDFLTFQEKEKSLSLKFLLDLTNTRVLQKVLSLGSDYFSATFYQTYFYYKPSKYSPFTETHFCNLFTKSRKADK